jgi:phosphotransferase system enzyme I (PtsI)
MCGEMASDPLATLLLLGFGMTEFSVNPSALLKIKKIITSVDMAYAREVAENAMKLSTAEEISQYLHSVIPPELRDYL